MGKQKKKEKLNITLRQKLMLSHGAVCLFIILVGIIGIISIKNTYENGVTIYSSSLKTIEILKSLDQNIKEIDKYAVSMTTDLDMLYHNEYTEQVQRLQQENQALMEEYERIPITKKEVKRYKQCRYSIQTYNKLIKSLIDYVEDGKYSAALSIYEQELQSCKTLTYEQLEAVIQLSETNAQKRNEQNKQSYMFVIWVTVIVMLIAICVAIVITMVVSKHINNKLKMIQSWARDIGEYDVSGDIEGYVQDEFADTYDALNASQFMVRELLEKIMEESFTICDTGEEVGMAIKKSSTRIESVNVRLYDVIKANPNSKGMINEIQEELDDISMYLEQVGITSDYQTEVAKRHQEQVQKFKVRNENGNEEEVEE